MNTSLNWLVGLLSIALLTNVKAEQKIVPKELRPADAKEKDDAGEHKTAYRTKLIDGLTIFYREAGPKDAPVLLLLHGLPSSSRMFAPNVTLLRARQCEHTQQPSPYARPDQHSADTLLPCVPPQCAASGGYFYREFYKACSRPRRSLAQSRMLEVPPVQLILGFRTP